MWHSLNNDSNFRIWSICASISLWFTLCKEFSLLSDNVGDCGVADPIFLSFLLWVFRSFPHLGSRWLSIFDSVHSWRHLCCSNAVNCWLLFFIRSWLRICRRDNFDIFLLRCGTVPSFKSTLLARSARMQLFSRCRTHSYLQVRYGYF